MRKIFCATLFLFFCFSPFLVFGEDHIDNFHESSINFSEKIERIDFLIQQHPHPWYKNHAYLLCVEKLASKHLNLAQEFAKKIENPNYKLMAHVLIAKHQEDDEAKLTLEAASEEFYWDFSFIGLLSRERKSEGWARIKEVADPEIILFLKKNISKSFPGAFPFLSKIHNKLLKANEIFPSFEHLLTLTELEIAFPFLTNSEILGEGKAKEPLFFWDLIGNFWDAKNKSNDTDKALFPNITERIEETYKAAMAAPGGMPRASTEGNNRVLRLLECMGKIGNPRCLEMISQLRQELISYELKHEPYDPDFGYFCTSEIFRVLLSVEAKYPFLSSLFEEDFNHMLRIIEETQEKSLVYGGDWDLNAAKIVEAIAPHRLEAAKRLLTRIEISAIKLSAWLDCMKVQLKGATKLEEENIYEAFALNLERTRIPCDGGGHSWDDIFIKSADMFGIEKTMFVLDMVIKVSQKNNDSLYEDEELIDYDNILLTNSNDIPSKCLLINPYAISNVLKCLSAHQLPGTQELLNRMYQQIKEKMGIYSEEMIEMVRAELSLIDD